MTVRDRNAEPVAVEDRAYPIPWEAIVELVELGWFTLEELEAVPEPRYRTPTPADGVEVEGAVFVVEEVDRVLRGMARFKHTKGRWHRRPFRPGAWQIVYLIAPVFGWLAPTDGDGDLDEHGDPRLVRIIRELWLEIPRKNGKSTIAAVIGIILLVADGEAGGQVYAAATNKGQAGVVFDEAKAMLRTCSRLRGKYRPLTDVIRVPRTNSFFRVLSRIADAAHGLNVSGGTVDEVHVHKSRDLIDAIRTGTGARAQPLIALLTTADDGDETTIYAELHNDIVALAEGTAEPDATTYGVIFAADEEDDPLDPATWALANPGLGTTVSRAYLEREAKRARRLPSYLPVFQRLHLNVRTRAAGRWLSLTHYDQCGGIIDEEELVGERCYGGLDMGGTSDWSAWVLLFPWEVRPLELDEWGKPTGKRLEPVAGYRLVPRLFVPEAAVARRERMAPAIRRWAAEGWVTITPGDAADHGAIERQIERDAERFELVEFAYDPWQAEGLRQRLMDGGLEGVRCSQKLATLAAPSRELERLILERLLEHGGNPALRWMVSNTIPFRDGDGNTKPDKRKSPEKIDGVSAAVMTLYCAIRPRDEESDKDGFAMVIGGEQ